MCRWEFSSQLRHYIRLFHLQDKNIHPYLAGLVRGAERIWAEALPWAGLCLQAPAPTSWAPPEVFGHASYSSHTDHDLWGPPSKTHLSQMRPHQSEMRIRMSGTWERGRKGSLRALTS